MTGEQADRIFIYIYIYLSFYISCKHIETFEVGDHHPGFAGPRRIVVEHRESRRRLRSDAALARSVRNDASTERTRRMGTAGANWDANGDAGDAIDVMRVTHVTQRFI